MTNTDFNQFEKTLHETLSLDSHIQPSQQIIIAVVKRIKVVVVEIDC